MKIFDPEKWIFYLTALAMATVFVFLTPTTQIIAFWFPGKTDWLWFYPSFFFAAAFSLWTAYRLSLPYLVRRGIFEDRRCPSGRAVLRGPGRWLRWMQPALRLLFQTLLLAGVCSWAVAFMRSGWFQKLLGQIAVNQR